ncbi:MAG TPA: hypothetical protein VEX62_10000 [Candidatus Limnocylindrales bacterium]|nr:hypothetical protein [Candidatus Limnocylindrales bacterium]
MTAPSVASAAASTVTSGPCGAARDHVDSRCAEAERLAAAAAEHQQRLRDARLELSEVVRDRERDAATRDRRSLNEAKDEARLAYRAALARADGPGDIQAAAAEWLNEINRLNRQVRSSERNSDEVVRRATEIEGAMPGIELAADAARIAAESAQASCLEARRKLAACEEDAQRRVAAGGRTQQRPVQPPGAMASSAGASAAAVTSGRGAAVTARSSSQSGSQLSAMLRGDRQTLLGLALRLSEDTGIEAGRLQLLLLEMREAMAARALEENFLRFPDVHPFWGQFDGEGASRVVASLASLGYRFDGRDGWADGRAPTARDLALALSHSDFDPRSLRRPAGQAAIDGLWQGTVVLTETYLRARAPNLTVEQVNQCLGPRAARLGELWDNWGRIRPVLIGTA